MAKNESLNRANKAKQDEFYTQLNDISRELSHYAPHFKGAVVFCNCDDPETSNFWKYFELNFTFLGLKKLIATHYETDRPSYKLELVRDVNGDGRIDKLDIIKTPLRQNGDFRSSECVEILKEADIVVTNPPFSLFREYVAQLLEYGKKFLVIGPQNATHYKEIFPLIRDNKIWLGYGFQKGDAYFWVPPENAEGYAPGVYNPETGLVHFRNCTWFTNMDIAKRHEDLILFRAYDSEKYPTYENLDAIEVGAVADIPCDYEGMMGVPDTFLNVYNPEQFEIVGLGSGYLGQSIGVGGIPKEHKAMMKSHSAAGDVYYLKDGVPKVPYSRVIVRRKR